jgi:hypothetical protein
MLILTPPLLLNSWMGDCGEETNLDTVNTCFLGQRFKCPELQSLMLKIGARGDGVFTVGFKFTVSTALQWIGGSEFDLGGDGRGIRDVNSRGQTFDSGLGR